MTKKRYYMVPPAAVCLIIMSVFYTAGLYPFGVQSISWCDMNQQVVPFLMDFKDILSGKADLFLNLQNAGGMSFWGVFLFFISSPFTFLVALVNKSEMYHLVNLMVALKMMTCALTASIFFGNRFRRLSLLQNSALSVMYAFCGYTMFYYQNQVWLDIMYLFPVLLLGMALLLGKNRVWLYILSFSMILAVNFYLSYMVSIFLVLAYGTYLIACVPHEKRRKSVLLLGLSTILVALLTAVVWMPSLLQYVHSARTEDLITSLKTGSFLTRMDTTLPVIFSTGAVISTILFYIGCSVGHNKKTRVAFLLLILTLIPVFVEPINKMWQTGNYQAFPVRYGYMPVFLGLALLGWMINEMSDDRLPAQSASVPLFISMIAVGALFITACLLLRNDYATITVYTKTLWGNSSSLAFLFAFSAVAGLAYLVLLCFYRFRQLGKTAFSVLLCFLTVIEAVFCSSVYLSSAANTASSYGPVLQLSDQIKDNSLYRVKMEQKYFDVNLAGSLGYGSLSHYTSLTNQEFMFTMKKLGYSSYWMEVGSSGGTAFSDAILGNRYSILRQETETESSDTVYQNGSYVIRKNSLSLPVGMVMNTDSIQSLKSLPDKTRLDLQEWMYQSVFQTGKSLFTDYEPTSYENISLKKGETYKITFSEPYQTGLITYQIPVKGTQTLYFDCFDRLSNSLIEPINSSFHIYVNGILLAESYPSQMQNGLLNLGTFTNQTVEIQVEVAKEVSAKSFGIAGMDVDVLKSAVSQANSADLHQEGNTITGTATAQSKNAWLFLPITYGDGYSAVVNGSQREIVRVFDSMMAVRLDQGKNTVTITYVPPGFHTGLWLTLAGVILFGAFLFALKRGWYGKIRFLEAPVSILFWMFCAVVFFAVYVFPLIVYLKF